MFLANHRSWADFFVDGFVFIHSRHPSRSLCGGASYVARLMVAVAVPGMVFTAWINNYVWLFHRKKNINRNWFTEFFKKSWDLRYDQHPFSNRPLDGVIVYPEGHRYTGKRSLPIKTGALEVAYNLKVPTQLVLSLDKENILSEKDLTFNFDVPIYSSISEVLHPEDYETKEAWFDKIREVWEATLDDLEEARKNNAFKACSLPLPGIAPEETHYYPINNKRVAILFSVVVAIIALLVSIGRLFKAIIH